MSVWKTLLYYSLSLWLFFLQADSSSRTSVPAKKHPVAADVQDAARQLPVRHQRIANSKTSFSTQKNTMKLRTMKNGERGIIKAITIRGNLGLRLREMGLFPGTTIKIEGRAPLYDPVRLKLHGQMLTLRNNEADHIEMYTQEQKQ